MGFKVKDDKGRVILSLKDGHIAAARYVDMDDKFKEYVIEVYKELTGDNTDKLKKFLDFDENVDEFCS